MIVQYTNIFVDSQMPLGHFMRKLELQIRGCVKWPVEQAWKAASCHFAHSL
jgi:hypothetical protein